MVVPVYIDIEDLAGKFDITQEQVDQLCDNIAKTLAVRYAAALETEANNSLHQTRRIYTEAIQVVDTGKS
jgi:hypothetical protein